MVGLFHARTRKSSTKRAERENPASLGLNLHHHHQGNRVKKKCVCHLFLFCADPSPCRFSFLSDTNVEDLGIWLSPSLSSAPSWGPRGPGCVSAMHCQAKTPLHSWCRTPCASSKDLKQAFGLFYLPSLTLRGMRSFFLVFFFFVLISSWKIAARVQVSRGQHTEEAGFL